MDTVLGAAHAIAWAIYVGGAVTMEIILRFVQKEMPGPQAGLVCKTAGMRYRWIALAMLVVIGATGGIMLLRLDDAELAARPGSPKLSLADAYGQTMLALALAWALLTATVAAMAFWLHPAQRRRSKPHMTEGEIAAERRRVGRAMSRMEKALRFELWLSLVAMLLGASLGRGGLL